MAMEPGGEINRFVAKYAFLSNFWECDVVYEGDAYPSAEHAYQAAKTLDEEEKEVIRQSHTALKAKRLGRAVKLQDDWNEIKLQVMKEIVRAKFVQNPDLRKKLVATGNRNIVEGNYWGDTFWGVCRGKGENHLGMILMKVREELR